MKLRIQHYLLNIHFIALIIAILNSIVKNLTRYSLAGHIELGIELLVTISGLLLFFLYLQPFKKINYYFSVYAVIAFFLLIGLIFRGLVWGLVLSVILFPLIPDDIEYEENGIVVSTPFQGFMTPCCTYQIKERQLLLFEKEHGVMELGEEGPIDFETMTIKSSEDVIEITYSTNFAKDVIKKKEIKK